MTMIVRGTLAVCVGCVLAMGATAHAEYVRLLDLQTQIRIGAEYGYLNRFCFEGTTGYFVLTDIERSISDNWGEQITKVTDIDGVSTQSILVSHQQWVAFTGINPEYPAGDHLNAGSRMKIVGDYLQLLDVFTDSIYRIHKETGAISLFVSAQDIKDYTHSTSVSLLDSTDFSPDNDMAIYDQSTDQVLLIAPDGTLSTLIAKNEFVALYGREPINLVAGGMTFDSQGRFYWALSVGSTTGDAGGSIYRRNCDGTLVRLLDEITILLGIPDPTYYPVQFNDLFCAPDGLVYFYDRATTVDSIVSFDPADPENTITLVLSESDIADGPAGPGEVNLGVFNTYNGQLVWNLTSKETDLYAVPLVDTVKSPADFNQDDAVDGVDLMVFEACAGGPGIPYDPENLPGDCVVEPGCSGIIPPDLDRDGDVDSVDFGLFQRAYTFGPPAAL